MLNKEADQASPGSFASMLRFRDHEKAAGVTAADLMTSPAVTIGPDEPVVDAARLMRDRRIKRLPVTNATGHLIGVISRVDVLSVFSRPDAHIRHEVMDEMVRGGFLVPSQPPRFFEAFLCGSVSSHGLGLDEAIGLALALDRMPGRLIVHAAEAADLSQGTGLTPAVAAVIGTLAAAVLQDLAALPR